MSDETTRARLVKLVSDSAQIVNKFDAEWAIARAAHAETVARLEQELAAEVAARKHNREEALLVRKSAEELRERMEQAEAQVAALTAENAKLRENARCFLCDRFPQYCACNWNKPQAAAPDGDVTP